VTTVICKGISGNLVLHLKVKLSYFYLNFTFTDNTKYPVILTQITIHGPI